MAALTRAVIAPNWIGDAVMSLPVLRALRRARPADTLAVLARKGPAAIYRAEGSADRVIVQTEAPIRIPGREAARPHTGGGVSRRQPRNRRMARSK